MDPEEEEQEVDDQDQSEETETLTHHHGPGTFVGTVESDGTVYKIVEYHQGSGVGELQMEEVLEHESVDHHHHHLATTEDGTLIHLRTIDGSGTQAIPIRFHHHGPEEAATLLRLQDFGTHHGMIEDEEEEEQTELHEVKILGQPEHEYLQIFTEEQEPVEIHLNLDEDGTVREDINVTEGLSEDYDGEGAQGGGLVLDDQSIVKEKEPSTAAALDLGCEWSLALPFGFQGQGLNEQCQKMILNVWHFFKHLKRYPEKLSDKNAQGLAGEALNVGTKTIGRIGKAFRKGKLQSILEQKTKRKRIMESKNTEAQKERKSAGMKKQVQSLADEDMDTSMDETPGPSRGRVGPLRAGRGGARAGSSVKSGRASAMALYEASMAASIAAAIAGGKRSPSPQPAKVTAKSSPIVRATIEFEDSN